MVSGISPPQDIFQLFGVSLTRVLVGESLDGCFQAPKLKEGERGHTQAQVIYKASEDFHTVGSVAKDDTAGIGTSTTEGVPYAIIDCLYFSSAGALGGVSFICTSSRRQHCSTSFVGARRSHQDGFPHRKNSYESSEAVRHCWCSRCALTCPLHVLGAYFKTLAAGTRPFALFKYGQVRIAIHEMMAELGVENPLDYGTHSFRRGHCDDLEQRGGTAAEICAMGSLAPFSR